MLILQRVRVWGPQRHGIKPCDLHEIALYLCGARTKRETERVFFPSGEENCREEGENEGISIPQKVEGEGAAKSDISRVVSQTQTCRMAATVSPQCLTLCAVAQPNVLYISQVNTAFDVSAHCMYESRGNTLPAQLHSSS